ncbi:EEV glycoprotein-like protein [Seal parapoxvirus]|uniref:Protein OPG161 n=1 Tax=Seal parapoxvirus TaxID=187984 RepID=A0A1Z3GCP9_9POXV|nr:EEV glycoprotein-like protein [Seal parapoxvirus]ASC55540.1 EEV glycoprotein-like protein [Seal parapoxvirus]
MVHNTFGDGDTESANAEYVASAKRQKAIRRYVKLFFRIMTALGIIILAALVIVLAISLDACKQQLHGAHYANNAQANRTCDGLFPGGKMCLMKQDPSSWSGAQKMCKQFGYSLPSSDAASSFPWLSKYLAGTWSNEESKVFKNSGDKVSVLDATNEQQKPFFCVS